MAGGDVRQAPARMTCTTLLLLLVASSHFAIGSCIEGEGQAKLMYGWSRYRYTKYIKDPLPSDKENAMLAGGDIKCDVCEVILGHLLGELARSKRLGGHYDQEIVAEALEADVIDEEKVNEAATEMLQYVEKYKKGCNRLFKESFLKQGWDIEECNKLAQQEIGNEETANMPPDLRVPWACARGRKPVPEESVMNTYSVQREAIHFACEATISHYREELSEYVAQHYNEFRKRPIKALAKEACKKAAKCEARKPKETLLARAKEMARRQDNHNSGLEEQIAKLEKKLKKEPKSKRRRRGVSSTEL